MSLRQFIAVGTAFALGALLTLTCVAVGVLVGEYREGPTIIVVDEDNVSRLEVLEDLMEQAR